MKPLQPVIKWSGSKRTVASQLGEFFLPANTYYEPFVGGGAMMPFAKSSFRKVIDKVQEDVLETVYLNYKSSLF